MQDCSRARGDWSRSAGLREPSKTIEAGTAGKIAVSARGYGELKDLLEETVVEVPRGATIKDFFAKLGEKNPGFASQALNERNQPLPHLIVVINSINIESAEGLDTALSDGDTVGIIPPVIGGTVSAADGI